MAKDKKSIILYCDLIHTVNGLSDEEAGKVFKHLLSYVNDLNPEPPDRLTQIVFEPIKQQLKRDLKSWEDELGKKSRGGRLGNIKRWNLDLYNKVLEKKISIEEAEEIATGRKVSHTDGIAMDSNRSASDSIASIAVNVNDNVNVTDTVNVTDIKLKELNIDFDSFWSAYDKKVGDKEKLKKKWQALTDAERESAMSYIPNYILSRPDKQFRKDPATFLNNKSWNDEIVKPANADKKNYKLRNAQGFERLFELTPTELEEKLSAKFWYLCA